MPSRNIKWKIITKRALKPDTFRNFLLFLFNTFSEAKAKRLANSYNSDANVRVLIAGYTQRNRHGTNLVDCGISRR